MYLKLAIRNANRSVVDYLLYIFTLIVLNAILYISNYIAFWGSMEAGFSTASLPFLIVLIMVFLVFSINRFMLTQRAKEFATYMLLGMKKQKLAFMFLCEIALIGIICFFIGVLAALLISNVCFADLLNVGENRLHLDLITKSVLYSFMYFCIAEILSVCCMKRAIYRLAISRLMNEKQRNQPLDEKKKTIWFYLFVISIGASWLMLFGIVLLPFDIGAMLISTISVPLLCCFITFYKWLYAFFSSKRIKISEDLYVGNRLYWIAEMTTGIKTSASINAIFSMCLLFSAGAFIFGSLLWDGNIKLFPNREQKWMAFLQISICVIFLMIYFCILSLLQIIDLKRQARNIKILHYMGKSQDKLKCLIRNQIIVKQLIPTLMCFVILLTFAPAINFKLNSLFLAYMHNQLIKFTGAFIICFVVLFFCYFYITYVISSRYINAIIKQKYI